MMTDYITITRQGETIWQTKCFIKHTEGEMPDYTDAVVIPAARTKVKVRYAPQLDPVLSKPGDYRVSLSRTKLPVGTIRSAVQNPDDRRWLMLEL